MRKPSVRRVQIVAVPAHNAHGFRWQWRSEDGADVSKRAFDLYYECVSDARSHGHEVQLAATPPDMGSGPAASD